jgi:putative nucleotidyltransferase with HDIG domain
MSDSNAMSDNYQRYQIISDLRKIKTLPPLPDIYFKVEMLAQNSDATSSDYSEILEYDTAVTARLLRMSNSAYYGFNREIKTVKDAVSLMGTKEIVSLVRLACITNNLKVSSQVEAAVKKIWQHSATCAISAQLITRNMDINNKKLAEELLICGILHDIGKVVLWKFFPDLYLQLFLNNKGKNYISLEDEKIYLNTTHSEVGKALAEYWQLPEDITNVIAYHHKPLVKPNSEIISIIHISDIISILISDEYDEKNINITYEFKAYTWDQIQSLANDLQSEIKEKANHVINMISC